MTRGNMCGCVLEDVKDVCEECESGGGGYVGKRKDRGSKDA